MFFLLRCLLPFFSLVSPEIGHLSMLLLLYAEMVALFLRFALPWGCFLGPTEHTLLQYFNSNPVSVRTRSCVFVCEQSRGTLYMCECLCVCFRHYHRPR